LVDVIDLHHRIFPAGNDTVDFIATDELCREGSEGEVPQRSPSATFALCPPIYYSLANGIGDNRRLNDRMHAIASASGNLFFGVAEPKYGEAARAELRRIAELGAAGVVWSPRAQGVFADDRQMADICSFAASLGLLSMIHTAPYSINESLVRIWHLAVKCLGIPIVVLGAFASWENLQAIQQPGGGPQNLHYDLSGLSAARDLEGTVAAMGHDRIVFGSGGPSSMAGIKAIVERAAISDAAKQAILHDNAARLLGLAGGGNA
jgi:predicted TIM-barrel fold metal-dependent hydrolase